MKKLQTKIKRQWRKLKYLDKTQTTYFILTSFIGAFFLFTGVTYSYFNLVTDKIGAATITIAKLKYTLTSPNAAYQNGTISIPSGETLIVDLTLESLNSQDTKYALNYESTSNVKVYYSENLKKNTDGVIGPSGSEVTMRIVIVNSGSNTESVKLTLDGGYLKNTLSSNITEGYFENDITVRSILLNDSLENGIIEENFPSKDGEYEYFRTVCSQNIGVNWNNTAWELNLDSIDHQVACDVYFKKPTNDVETYLITRDTNGQETIVSSVPENYTFEKSSCNTDAVATWDNTTRELAVTGVEEKTICIGYFKEG